MEHGTVRLNRPELFMGPGPTRNAPGGRCRDVAARAFRFPLAANRTKLDLRRGRTQRKGRGQMSNSFWRSTLAVALCFVAAAAPAQDQRMITEDEAPSWNAVGRLNIAGNRYCTGTLISPDEVITAAHCLFHPLTGHQTDPAEIRFVAGFRRDTYAAMARGSEVAVLSFKRAIGVEADPASIRFDLALIKLDQAIPAALVEPLTVAAWPADLTAVDIVGYGRDRPLIASIRAGCPYLTEDAGARLLACAAVPGLSGAPAVIAGSRDVVAVVSTMVGPWVDSDATLVVPIEPQLAAGQDRPLRDRRYLGGRGTIRIGGQWRGLNSRAGKRRRRRVVRCGEKDLRL